MKDILEFDGPGKRVTSQASSLPLSTPLVPRPATFLSPPMNTTKAQVLDLLRRLDAEITFAKSDEKDLVEVIDELSDHWGRAASHQFPRSDCGTISTIAAHGFAAGVMTALGLLDGTAEGQLADQWYAALRLVDAEAEAFKQRRETEAERRKAQVAKLEERIRELEAERARQSTIRI